MKSIVLHQYLLGYELPDTIILLTLEGHCTILATKKKCEFFRAAVGKAPPGSKILDLTLLERNKEDNNEQNYSILLDQAKKSSTTTTSGENGEKVKLGCFMKEWDGNLEAKNTMLAGWQKLVDESSQDVEKVDIAPGLGFAMAIKDETELDLMKKSSVLSNKVLKHGLIPKLEEIIDSEQSISHEKLAMQIEEIIENPSKIKLKVPQEHVQICYFPIVQSGGNYDIRLSASSSDKTLKYDIVIVSFGARYQLYCSNVSRTFLIDPPKQVSETYELLLSVHEECLKAMVPGQNLKSVYHAAVNKLRRQGREDLVKKLPKNLGFAIGLDFRESALLLSPKCPAILRAGMVFNLSVGFSNIALDEKDKATVNSNSAVRQQILYYALYLFIL